MGTDLVRVARVEQLLADSPELADQVFTERERAYCAGRPRRSGEHLAARFAAKEAVLKALGTGAAGADWTEVEIVNQLNGRPALRLHGRAAALAQRRGVRQTDVSLSHAAGFATAHAVLVCAAPDRPATPGPATAPGQHTDHTGPRGNTESSDNTPDRR